MANIENITCDFAECDKPFAYRVGNFNLCIEHISSRELSHRLSEEMIKLLRENVAKDKERRRVGGK